MRLGLLVAFGLLTALPALAQDASGGPPPPPPDPNAQIHHGTGAGGPPQVGASNDAPKGTGAGGPPAAGAASGTGDGSSGTGDGSSGTGDGAAAAGGGGGSSGTGDGAAIQPHEGGWLSGGGGGGGWGGPFGGWGGPPRGGPGGLHGLARLIHPERAQWIGMARFALRAHRAGASHLSALAALRLEIVEQMLAPTPDDKVVDAKVGELAQQLQKVADDAVALIFELREVLTPEQRKALTERLALCLIGAPGGPEQLLAGTGTGGHGPKRGPHGPPPHGPRPPLPPPPSCPVQLDVEQEAKLKRIAIHAAPPLVRAAGEIAAQMLGAADELLNENPARDKVKAAFDASVTQMNAIVKGVIAAVRDARAVLTPRQIEEALAKAPLPLLLGGMGAMRPHRGPRR